MVLIKIIKRDTEEFPYVPAELDKFCINCQHCLAICPTGAITCNGVTAAQCPPIGNVPSPENMLNLIRQRRSIRRYKQENLPPEVIAKLRESLAWSATGCNDDSLLFRIIDNKEDMTFFRETATKILCRLIKSKILQILYPNAKRLAPNLIAEDGSIGIRITQELFTRSLLFRFNRPLVSTSANLTEQPSPRFFSEISQEIRDAVDYIVDYRREDQTPTHPSSILKLGINGEIQIIRK